MNIEKPDISQKSSFRRLIMNDELINKQIQTDGENDFDLLYDNMTLREYKYFLYLIFNKHRSQLIRILVEKFNFKKNLI